MPPKSKRTKLPAPILAAGAVVWRRNAHDPSELEAAIIHRPHYDDWSFPKGKLDPGETPIVAAVREIHEETGLHVRLGRHLDRVTYPLPGNRRKRVDYWAAAAVPTPGDTGFRVNHEVDRLEWLPIGQAACKLSYPIDKRILRRADRVPIDTDTVLIVRHAKAGRSERYKGNDDLRPLEKLGRLQAAALAPQLHAFGGTRLYAADRTRCIQTIQPLAQLLRTDVAVEPLLGEHAYAANKAAARDRVLEIAAEASRPGEVPVLCTQGRVIPDLLGWWAARDGVSLPASRNRKASTWVLSLRDGKLVAVDHIGSPLPATAR